MTKTQVERTEYMQRLMTSTYSQVAVEAIFGGFEGSWERLIAKRLEADAQRDRSEAVILLEAAGGDPMKAAYIVTGSKPKSE